MSAPSPAAAAPVSGTLRAASLVALAVAFLHVVFGAIVRITGSGLGCLTSWPRCADPRTGLVYWFPPLDQPQLVIEWGHRALAAVLVTLVAALVALAWSRRAEPGVRGRGGVLRAAGAALALVLFAAAFGAVTVKVSNTPWATATHKIVAALTLATLAAAALRAGALGGAAAWRQTGSARAFRGARVAAVLAILAVLMGAFTAKTEGAVGACLGFPLCTSSSGAGTAHLQLTHRALAYLLALHLAGLAVAFARRREAPVVARTAGVAVALVVVQIALGAAMVTGHYVTAVRSLHQATGIALWLTAFVLAYQARIAAGLAAPLPAGGWGGRDVVPAPGRPLGGRPLGGAA